MVRDASGVVLGQSDDLASLWRLVRAARRRGDDAAFVFDRVAGRAVPIPEEVMGEVAAIIAAQAQGRGGA